MESYPADTKIAFDPVRNRIRGPDAQRNDFNGILVKCLRRRTSGNGRLKIDVD
jgi:hypothetical protein